MTYTKEMVKFLLQQYEEDGFKFVDLNIRSPFIKGDTVIGINFEEWEINYFEKYLELILETSYTTIYRIKYDQITMISIYRIECDLITMIQFTELNVT